MPFNESAISDFSVHKVVVDEAVIRGESEPLLVYENSKSDQPKAASDEG